jgi:hypothetical protein
MGNQIGVRENTMVHLDSFPMQFGRAFYTFNPKQIRFHIAQWRFPESNVIGLDHCIHGLN